MLPKSIACVVLALVLLLVLGSVALAADPAAEPKDKADCTGTCSTCPGKAKAMLGFAELKVAVIEAGGLDTEAQAAQVKERLGQLAGVESCVGMLDDHAVWVAYDAAQCSLKQLTNELAALKFKPGRNYVLDPLPPLKAKEQRCVVYVIVPPGQQQDAKLAQGLAVVKGLGAQRLDRMFNMLLLNYNPEQVTPEQIKQVLLKLGYPAGLPGEELTQP